MNEQPRTPRPFLLFLFAVDLVAAIALLASLKYAPHVASWSLLLLFFVSGALAESYTTQVGAYDVGLSLPLIMAATALAGPDAAVMVAAGVVVGDVRARRAVSTVMANLGVYVLAALAGSWVYLLTGGILLNQSPEQGVWVATDFPRILVPMGTSAATTVSINIVLVAVAVSLLHGERVLKTLRSVGWLLPNQLPLALVGFLMAQVLAITIVALPLFAFPLLVARQTYQRYTSLKDAYVDTVRSLVGALEAKDPYTRGHSERVSEYALRIGQEMGFDSRSMDRLEYAALLHDLGKLAMSRSILAKPGSLSEDESLAMRRHPQAGAEMVERIPPLRELAEFVRQHHERFGGQGYPLGASGEAIPMFSRVLAVADSYDAMTTTRPYRRAMTHAEAVAELNEGSGSQFDPQVVMAFLSSETRVGDPELAAGSVPAVDSIAHAAVDGAG